MDKPNYSTEDLRKLIDIAKNVIDELKYFYTNYEVGSTNIGEVPTGMDDLTADLYVKQNKSSSIVQEEYERLKNEPFIGWVKTLKGDIEEIYLICRNYTPDLLPFGKNTFFVNKFAEVGYLASSTSINTNFEYGGAKFKVLYRDRLFIPRSYPEIDGINNTIDLDTGTFTIESLLQLLGLKEVDLSKEISDIVKEELERIEITKGLKRRIIENIELRDQPILDEIQTLIYRTPIQSNLIITGAPGTGKTTVLINRISLSTKPHHLTDDEKKGLSTYALRLLKDNTSNWVLYTPTELLGKYLQQAFNKENIPAYDRTIKVWHTERMDLGKYILKFLKVGEKGTFIRTPKKLLLVSTNNELVKLANDFNDYFQTILVDKIKSTTNDLNKFAPEHEFTKSFKKRSNEIFSDIEKIDLDGLMRILDEFSRLRPQFNNIKKSYDFNLEDLSNHILKDDNSIIDKIIETGNISDVNEQDEIDDEEMPESDEIEVTPDDVSKAQKLEALRKLRRAISLKAERDYKKQSISSKHSLINIISLFENFAKRNKEKFEELGKQKTILKITNVTTSGIVRNLIQSIPSYYNKYRMNVLRSSENNYYSKEYSDDILIKKQITDYEIDIIIYLMLKNTHKYFSRNQGELIGKANNEFIQNIKEKYANLVTVDESTDFSILSLGCMYYMCNPLIRSITFTGDPMQRVTKEGINNWNDCNFITKKWDVRNLHLVYRQSPKLLKIAWELYNKFVGEPPFSTAFVDNPTDPDPLRYHSIDNNKFKEWITRRILKIIDSTDGKASIALFVSNDSEIDELYELINESLNENNIEVDKCKEGRILGTTSKVRIFSVEYIKGLEFESVFFINIDKIYEQSPELIDKYLYVGLTRAGTYLAVSYKTDFPEPIKFIKENFKESD